MRLQAISALPASVNRLCCCRWTLLTQPPPMIDSAVIPPISCPAQAPPGRLQPAGLRPAGRRLSRKEQALLAGGPGGRLGPSEARCPVLPSPAQLTAGHGRPLRIRPGMRSEVHSGPPAGGPGGLGPQVCGSLRSVLRLNNMMISTDVTCCFSSEPDSSDSEALARDEINGNRGLLQLGWAEGGQAGPVETRPGERESRESGREGESVRERERERERKRERGERKEGGRKRDDRQLQRQARGMCGARLIVRLYV